MESLRHLLWKKVSFIWLPEAETSFTNVKTCTWNTPVLTISDPSLPIVVTTDTSNYALGAVFQQQHGSQLRTVAFASRISHGCQVPLLYRAEKSTSLSLGM